ncbi:MAG TPA: hypothetical protein VMU87_22725 [Stellaceae bacterium]|nr:hypothetical protein [Stellaceae bacterium]
MRELKFAGYEGRPVTLGGRNWVMADLAPRQFRKVIPAILSLGGVRASADLDEAKIDRLLDALYFALTRNYPDLAREEFLDLPIRLPELFAALPVLCLAAGLERREGEPGEAQGAAENSSASLIH